MRKRQLTWNESKPRTHLEADHQIKFHNTATSQVPEDNVLENKTKANHTFLPFIKLLSEKNAACSAIILMENSDKKYPFAKWTSLVTTLIANHKTHGKKKKGNSRVKLQKEVRHIIHSLHHIHLISFYKSTTSSKTAHL